MNVSLTPDLEQFIQNQIKSGKYTSASEVIQAALQMFVQQQDIYKGRFEELQKEIMIGIEASKRGEVVDADVVFSQLQAKLNNLREQAGE
ncbi:type II toxin-antitoxin system ParD family antitoxin [Aetokthonos hydrillicola Thurmond2011]|jgi:antitoxin ParD1/3/4|uniref:Type II toxin-antitoxin system ParD family antitoxin n=1 Tax=Aetokthonos hydrillicola Thurmond2011 TaxID=2712845 RepID=A0AAP5IGY0_9CYAN|nr:type II toxin-antitoxin system ParD family antitoxin [Aetokthonos hydrillicola]MBW4590701.1 type II toxin-antitoxin system ParD family antitoxin [Aetokthonos hydrillicola CCALA 1050]MDR9899833.1 type II toxin-antitoxin system ParD family antitoxin [Aetokthonos hydrillicola Thurmond2011]